MQIKCVYFALDQGHIKPRYSFIYAPIVILIAITMMTWWLLMWLTNMKSIQRCCTHVRCSSFRQERKKVRHRRTEMHITYNGLGSNRTRHMGKTVIHMHAAAGCECQWSVKHASRKKIFANNKTLIHAYLYYAHHLRFFASINRWLLLFLLWYNSRVFFSSLSFITDHLSFDVSASRSIF